MAADSGNSHRPVRIAHAESPNHVAETVIVIPDDDGKAVPQLRDVAGDGYPMLG
ncbi:hypothetical protein [Mesorhizobium sp. WSM2561]|uniref:hypothetical protein n=1 Tax=Mesorhizobium sp. WSM2561 TaxID=1040985 RepID=UPI0018DB4CFD|nr:hypothetical protein [Mesorhizobium sp. WSM2561]